MTKARAKDSVVTAADLAAAGRLSAIWEREAKSRGLTQEKAGGSIGEGITQGAVGHYLRGRTALGLAATLQFAKMLGVHPHEIRDDLPGLDALPSQAAGIDRPKLQVAIKFLEDMFRAHKREFFASQQVDLITTVYDEVTRSDSPPDLVALTVKFGLGTGEANERQDEAGSAGKNDQGRARRRASK